MYLTIKLCTHAKLNCLKLSDYLYKMDLALNNLQRLICHNVVYSYEDTIRTSDTVLEKYTSHFI